jgi:hypothetical protein
MRIVGEVDGIGSAVGEGEGHGFFGSSGKHGVGIGVTVVEIVGDAVGVGVWRPVDSSSEAKFEAIPAALSSSETPMIP